MRKQRKFGLLGVKRYVMVAEMVTFDNEAMHTEKASHAGRTSIVFLLKEINRRIRYSFRNLPCVHLSLIFLSSLVWCFCYDLSKAVHVAFPSRGEVLTNHTLCATKLERPAKHASSGRKASPVSHRTSIPCGEVVTTRLFHSRAR